jgi:hypothetical protein
MTERPVPARPDRLLPSQQPLRRVLSWVLTPSQQPRRRVLSWPLALSGQPLRRVLSWPLALSGQPLRRMLSWPLALSGQPLRRMLSWPLALSQQPVWHTPPWVSTLSQQPVWRALSRLFCRDSSARGTSERRDGASESAGEVCGTSPPPVPVSRAPGASSGQCRRRHRTPAEVTPDG